MFTNLLEVKSNHYRYGRKLGYWEYNHLWDRYQESSRKQVYKFEKGQWISPAGNVWRPCGLGGAGILLVDWNRGLAHGIDFGTTMRMEMLGWKWESDKKK